MKRLSIAITLVYFICTIGTAGAVEFDAEPVAMFYWQIPFGSKARKHNVSTYGFKLDYMPPVVEDFRVYRRLWEKPAVFDLQFNGKEMDAFKIYGFNVSPHRTVLYNAGSEQELKRERDQKNSYAFVWWGIGFGIVGVIAVSSLESSLKNP